MESNAREVVLVTGGSGFIGRALVRRLAQRYRVVALDRDSPPHPPAEAECVCIDLTSESSLHAALERVRVAYGQRIASIIHLAAYFDLEGKPDPHYERITVRGTEKLLQALRPFQLEQFVFASTMLVHAPSRPGTRIDEDSPIDARLPYPASKIATERLLHEQHADVPLVVVRPSGVYDDGGHAAFLAEQISRIYERSWQGHVYPGDAQTGQPFLHLEDLVDALVRIVDRRQSLPPELTLLLAETETPSFGALQHAIGCLVYGEQWKTVKIPPVVARVGAALEDRVLHEDAFVKPWMVDISSDHYEVDVSRASRWLDWTPRHALLGRLPRIIEGLKADPPGWYRSNKLDPALVADRAVPVLTEPAPAPESEVREHVRHMRGMHFDMLWVHWLNLMLGAWLISGVFAFGLFDAQGFSDAIWQVTRDRALPDPQQRLHWLALSDLASGALVMGFAALSLSPRFAWAQWANAAAGIWLLFAPLVFWSPSAAVYANDTLVGALVIASAILVPMMPGMSAASMMDASDMPVGWNYSPSTYLQRLPIVALGFVGFVIARQLAAYQLGHVNGVWEPFFAGSGGRNGTESIVTSSVSKAWPIADGGLGAVSYVFEVLMGVMGDSRRWRTMPWMVAAFGVVVVPLGVISIYFIVIQPIVLGTWCTLCLIAASAMLMMIPLTLDELVAMGQFLVQSHRRGESFRRIFFTGGASPGAGRDTQPSFGAPTRTAFCSAVRGVNVPWTLAASVALGTALMFTRLIFDTHPPMADSDHLTGALIVTVAVCAMAEVGRPLRFINIGFGLWLLAAPWLLAGASTAASVASVLVGLTVIALSLPRGRRSEQQYGAWNRWIL
jgi:nucleoside-diphosphate-sugar epimerase/uncharacterized membrane protein